jgi:hypothetical protein
MKSARLFAISALCASIGFAAQASTTYSMYCTLYGWLDNSPPGNAIAYPQIHSGAGGTGTYSDPVTFATDQAELAPGTRVYVAYMKKYFIMEDDCAQCDTDWQNSGMRHIDLWAGGDSNSGQSLLDCEDSLTEQANVIVNPPTGETVDTTPIYNTSTGQCYTPGSGGGGSFTGTYQIQNEASGLYLNISNNLTINGACVIQWTGSTTANEEFTFTPTDSGYYQMVSVLSGKDVVVQGASTSAGAKLIQWSFGSSGDDQWKPVQNSDGSYTFYNRNSGMVMDDPGSSTTKGTQMIQWGVNGGSNQKWNLIAQ